MPGLLDIAPVGQKVAVRGKEIQVQGVSAKGVASLLSRFPEIRNIMNGREPDVQALTRLSGDVVCAIIAAGCGHPGDEQYETAADGLSVDEQTILLEPILQLTMPGGIGPFVSRLANLGEILSGNSAPRTREPATKSPKQSKRS